MPSCQAVPCSPSAVWGRVCRRGRAQPRACQAVPDRQVNGYDHATTRRNRSRPAGLPPLGGIASAASHHRPPDAPHPKAAFPRTLALLVRHCGNIFPPLCVKTDGVFTHMPPGTGRWGTPGRRRCRMPFCPAVGSSRGADQQRVRVPAANWATPCPLQTACGMDGRLQWLKNPTNPVRRQAGRSLHVAASLHGCRGMRVGSRGVRRGATELAAGPGLADDRACGNPSSGNRHPKRCLAALPLRRLLWPLRRVPCRK
ncbi:MAG: hypothetical protein BWZ02_02585 [Lentisphaerae bacterium ADurb.BinA184]|nr:MAG: hypothetical protein BWZ02_02585 [Lentisphaerae bacterium ADurb.BinA184]